MTTKQGKRVLRKTTIGWELLVNWKYGSQEWVPLKLLKESNSVEVAVFFIDQNIADEPSFSWWVPFVLRKRDRIISAVNSHVRKATHKFGIKISTSVVDCA